MYYWKPGEHWIFVVQYWDKFEELRLNKIYFSLHTLVKGSLLFENEQLSSVKPDAYSWRQHPDVPKTKIAYIKLCY